MLSTFSVGESPSPSNLLDWQLHPWKGGVLNIHPRSSLQDLKLHVSQKLGWLSWPAAAYLICPRLPGTLESFGASTLQEIGLQDGDTVQWRLRCFSGTGEHLSFWIPPQSVFFAYSFSCLIESRIPSRFTGRRWTSFGQSVPSCISFLLDAPHKFCTALGLNV